MTRARPKSPIFTLLWVSKKILPGFRSRCRILWESEVGEGVVEGLEGG